MLQESLDALHIQPGGRYIDLTFGGGGHSRALLGRLSKNGRLLAFDQDPDVHPHLPGDGRFAFADTNFRHLKRFATHHNMLQADGILADLGISSHQVDEPTRGFAFRHEAGLDMRMNPREGQTAGEFLRQAGEEEIARVLKQYGEITAARRVAQWIALASSRNQMNTTADLCRAIEPITSSGKERQITARLFQAIRIHLNDELQALREMLQQTAAVCAPGGYLVVISYHSLEDRLVKQFMRSGHFHNQIEKDVYGHPIRPFEPDPAQALQASEQETAANPRARSARLRAARRTQTPWP
jgi:16S rRNA (cytosine1402-N4)-methyltransferase